MINGVDPTPRPTRNCWLLGLAAGAATVLAGLLALAALPGPPPAVGIPAPTCPTSVSPSPLTPSPIPSPTTDQIPPPEPTALTGAAPVDSAFAHATVAFDRPASAVSTGSSSSAASGSLNAAAAGFIVSVSAERSGAGFGASSLAAEPVPSGDVSPTASPGCADDGSGDHGGAGFPGRWQPAAGLTWQWQLTGRLDLTVAADVYDIDAFTATADEVAALHQVGRKVICYVNAGAYEDFRPDRHLFPWAVLGAQLNSWPGERWLDIRRWDVLEPILAGRFSLCRDKGFDAIEPDNIDGYANDSGFPLTAADQLQFNRRLAGLAHRLGLAIGLKNDVEQATELAEVMDFAVSEECVRYRECEQLSPFISMGKPVFHAEYELSPVAFCPVSVPLGFSSIHKRLELDAWRDTCP